MSHADLTARCGFLVDWFRRYGRDPRFEIEARLKDVSPLEYASILSKLESNPVRARGLTAARIGWRGGGSGT